MRRIGYLYPERDPISPVHWSGTPSALAGGLMSLGLEVVPIAYHLPPVVRHGVFLLSRMHGRSQVAHAAPVKAWTRSRVLAQNLARAQPLDALVALGTDLYDLSRVAPPGLPVATYDDGTLAQFMRHSDSDVRRSGFPEAEVRQWCDRQSVGARHATACCVATTWAAASMVDDYGVPGDRVHVVGMGHRPRHSDGDGRDWSQPRFLFVGVDWNRKNGPVVLDAFRRLHAENPRATLDVIGNHPALDAPGVRGHGFLARDSREAQQHLEELYARATVFLLPSRYDPSPVASLEAASAGLPVVTTTEGGAREMLGEAAITVHPDDVDALFEAMRRLSDPVVAKALGQLAAQRAKECTWQEVARRIMESLRLSSNRASGWTRQHDRTSQLEAP
jgi:glycosyltransferase involved in cell wall biosynthesis